MFVQVISGAVSDPGAIKAQLDRWQEELSSGASGWLGTTAGVTADNTFIAFARFESTEAARRNSDRPEQGAWWAETEKCFTGEVAFDDYDDMTTVRAGGSDDAGFVQAMLGTTSDPARARELLGMFDEVSGDFRPDIIGGLVGIHDDGRFAQVFYFTSEAEARAGEQQEPPADLGQAFAEEQALTTEIRYLDLTEPWLSSPR